MTASEMAEKLKLPLDTVKKRLLRAGRKPFCQEALYTEEDFKAISEVPPRGWQKGKPRKPKEEPAPKPKKSKK